LKLPLLPGEEPSPLLRICAAADFPNGISYRIDPQKTTFINPDVTVYVQRLPVGEWVLVDARTWVEPHGTGMTEGGLYDQTGRIGRSLQSLLVEPRA
jgi:acyl-CoA thioesterase